MIPRYTRPEMGRIWTPEAKYRTWLRVEILACEAMARLGQVPREAVAVIKRRAAFDPQRIEAIEREVRHDVIAFLTNVAEHVGPEARYLHQGLTSSDVLDTALAVHMCQAADLLLEGMDRLLAVLREQAQRHKHTVMIGRSHGVHAEPTTFGLKLALWYAEMQRNRERLVRAREVIRYGKLSGAVGTFANVDPRVEAYVCRRLGLKPAPVSTQVIQRDRHAEYLTTLAIVAASIEKIATEIPHLQRTEVLEVEEPFEEGQKGSSAMPHKRNPVGAENLTGLARVVRSNALAALENVSLWHERDISHSSVERVIIPDSTILLDYMLHRLTGILERLVVYPERMRANLELTRGLIHSQRVLLALTRKGLSREEAYRLVQRNAMKAWRGSKGLLAHLLKDPQVRRHLSPSALRECFDLEYHLKHVDTLFQRVFGKRRTSQARRQHGAA